MPLSPAQIAAYASNAGFSGTALQTAVGIALAESGGNPNVIGDTNLTPGGSVGLMQINLAAHPEYDGASLLDPQTNMNAAYDIYQSAGGFTPWTTYNTGAAAAYLPSTSPISISALDLIDDDSGGSTSIDPNVLIVGALLAAAGLMWWMAD